MPYTRNSYLIKLRCKAMRRTGRKYFQIQKAEERYIMRGKRISRECSIAKPLHSGSEDCSVGTLIVKIHTHDHEDSRKGAIVRMESSSLQR
jgi:hypothetical protein